MSTLADELLNDFEDSGSEGEDQENGGFLQNDDSQTGLNGHAKSLNHDGMELDGDEEEVEDAEMGGVGGDAIEPPDDEEEAKAKVEKMQLGGVDDVRSVAGLMKTLEPVLEVSHFPFLIPQPFETGSLHLFGSCNSPDYLSDTFRKLHIFRICLQRSKRLSSAPWKTTRNTTF